MVLPTCSQQRAGRRATIVARTHFFALVAVLGGALVAGGCGGHHGEGQKDAAADEAPEPQDAAQSDLTVGPMACAREYRRCEDAGAGFCLEEGLECVSVRVDTPASVCLRRCADTAQCPFNSYCVPTGADVVFGGLKLAAHHCFGSVCGKIYGNGELFGSCKVGGDNLVSLDAGQQRPGTCVPFDTDAGIGACVESGDETDAGTTAGRDHTCTLDMVEAACPPREQVIGCVTGTICVGQLCDSLGSCALLCDPRLEPEGQCAVGVGKPKQFCQDISPLTLGASGKLHLGYAGVCQENQLCRLFAPRQDGGAPGAGCSPTDDCYPSTMATTNGVCSQSGSKAVGEACQFLNDCAAGNICVGDDPCGKGTCQQVCPLPDDSQTCGTGKTCAGVALDTTQPTVTSIPWGVCVEAHAARSTTRARVMVRPLAARRR